MNGVVPLRIFPVVAVEGRTTMLPAEVTVVSSVVIRELLSSTAVFTAPKLPFTSEAFAGVPALRYWQCHRSCDKSRAHCRQDSGREFP